ncbi:MAG: Mth938-like domain-containing protein, partial [Alphaproteobacteria bacterium]
MPTDQAGTIIQPARFPGRAAIEAYGNGGFRFAEMSHIGSILALPDGIEAWPPHAVAAIDDHTLAPLLQRAAAIDVLLIGTGAAHEMLSAQARQALSDAGIAYKIVSTGAAVRTY